MRAFEPSSLLADPAPIWLGDAPSLADDDPMAQVLPWLIRHLGVAEALADDTGLDDAACRARPGQLLQSLQQLGFDTQLSHDALTRLPASDLPAVLRLRTGDACVLTALQTAPHGQRRCQVVVLAPEPMVFTVTDVDLARECTGPALLIRQPRRAQTAAEPALARQPLRSREPAAESASAMAPAPAAAPAPAPTPARALEGRRAAPMARDLPTMPAVRGAPVAAAAPAASPWPSSPAAATRMAPATAATVRPQPQPPALPTLDEVIEADELAALVARAAGPGHEHWLQALPAAESATHMAPPTALPTGLPIAPGTAPGTAPATPPATAPAAAPPRPQALTPPSDAAAPRTMAMPEPARVVVAAPSARADTVPIARPDAVPGVQPALAASPSPVLPDLPAPPPAADADGGVVLDLGFLDRQTGAGRLRGQIAQWQHRLRRRIDHLAAALPNGLTQGLTQGLTRGLTQGLTQGLARGLAIATVPRAAVRRSGVSARRAPPVPAMAPALVPPAKTAAWPPGLAAEKSTPDRSPGWRPRFGLGWPLGQAADSVAAANSAAPILRREPTLSAAPDVWRGAMAPVLLDGALDVALDGGLDLGWPEAMPQAAVAPQAWPRQARAARDPAGLATPASAASAWLPPITDSAPPCASVAAAYFAEPPPTRNIRPGHAAGLLAWAGADRSIWWQRLRAMLARITWRPWAGQGAGAAQRWPAQPAQPAQPAMPAMPAMWAAVTTAATVATARAARAPTAMPAHPPAAAWPARLGDRLKDRLSRRAPQSLAGGLAAGAAVRLRQASAAARRGAAAAGRRLERGLSLPLLTACSAVCLLDGLPLAWAGMVPLSSLKAAALLLPGLMRQALAADQAQAAAALSGALPTAPTAVAKARAPGARSPVPLAANAPQLAAAAAGLAPDDPAMQAMLAARAARAERAERAEKAERARARARGVDIATTLRRRSEVLAMGPPAPAARQRRTPTPLADLLAA